jgi:hypothetical protein
MSPSSANLLAVASGGAARMAAVAAPKPWILGTFIPLVKYNLIYLKSSQRLLFNPAFVCLTGQTAWGWLLLLRDGDLLHFLGTGRV